MRVWAFAATSIVFVLGGLVMPPSVSSQVVVALSGTAAPAGGNYASFSAPVLNGLGQVAFEANLGNGSSSSGIFAGAAGSIQSVALQGAAAPAGGNYNGINAPALNDSGQVAFSTGLTGGSSTEGIFVGAPGSVQAAVLQGTPAPSGGNYGTTAPPALNRSGQVAFFASGTSTTGGIFVGAPGAIQAAALFGTSTPAGGIYSAFDPGFELNRSGQVAFYAGLTGGPSTSGIFVGTPGSIQAAAIEGGTAPGGGTYSSLSNTPTLNGSGHVAFTAGVSGGSSTGGLFAGAVGEIQAVVLLGATTPSGGTFSGFGNPVLNASGQVAFLAGITGGPSRQGLFAGAPGALQTVALTGAAAPAGGNYTVLQNPVMNGVGQVAFTAAVTGTSSLDGLFAGSAGAVEKVVLDGDVINVAAGVGVDYRTVSDINFTNASNGEDGGMSFSDSGLLAYELTFTDGSSGIFTSQIIPVPEPTFLWSLAGSGGLLALGTRRAARRRGSVG